MKIIRIIIISLLFLFVFSIAQGNQKIDSLYRILSNENSSDNIEILLQLSKLHRNENIDIAMNYAKEALNMAGNLNDKSAIAYSNMKLGICYAIKGEYDPAIESFNKAKQLFEEIEDNDGLGQAYIALGRVNNFQGKNKNSILNYFEAIKCFEDTGYKNGLRDVYNNIGVAFEHLGDNIKALEYYYKALHIAESQKDKGALSDIYNNIGIIYFKENKYKKALSFYNQALDLIKNQSNNNQKSILLNNIALISLENKQYEKSLEFFKESLDIQYDIGEQYEIPITLLNIGNIYIEQENYELAKLYLDSAYNTAQKYDDNQSISEYYYYNAILQKKIGNNSLAIKNILKSIQLSDEYNLTKDLDIKYELVSDLYHNNKDYQNAFYWQSKLFVLRDSISVRNKNSSIVAMRANKEIENRVKQLEKENILHKARNVNLTLIIIGLILLISSSVVSYYVVRKHKAMVFKQEKEIKEYHFFQEETYKMITNDLRSTLFPLSYEILKLQGTKHYNGLNNTYMEFSKEFDRIVDAYHDNALKKVNVKKRKD